MLPVFCSSPEVLNIELNNNNNNNNNNNVVDFWVCLFNYGSTENVKNVNKRNVIQSKSFFCIKYMYSYIHVYRRSP